MIKSLSLIGLIIVASACNRSTTSHSLVEIREVDSYTDKVTTTGRLRSSQESFISVRNGGKLDALNISAGETVKEGQILAVIDKETKTANLERALSNYKLAKAENRRIKRLYRNGSTTQSELDKVVATLAVREAELKVSREDLDDAIIRSPIDGVVVYFAFKVGDVVPNGSRLAVIEDPNTLEARVKIPYANVKKVLTANTVQIAKYDLAKRVPVGDVKKVPAKISQIDLKSDYDSSYGELRVDFSELKGFKSGTLVHLTLLERRFDKVWSVPNEAIISRDQNQFVLFKSSNGEFKRKKIDIIESKGGRSMIGVNLETNELVIPRAGVTWQAFMKQEPIAKLF